jgi:RNA polymerase sigma factor (sigma-70 family)
LVTLRQNNTAIEYLCRTVLHSEQRMSDSQLLSAFIDRKDTDAFRALLQRHGPMVFSTCRRLLRDHHDAEDAFQAVFLILARKASSVKPRHMVANWLYGVARHTARKANAMNARRRGREKQVEAMPERTAVPVDAWHELQPNLDEALSRLPEKHRLPVILCDLEGKSIREAARQLGWPQGTLAGRLARGRQTLAKRLTRRGLALSSGTLAGLFAHNAATSTPVPAPVVVATARAAGVIAAGQSAIGMISPKVADLMEGVMKVMMFNKLKAMTVLLFMVALAGISGTMTHTALAGGPRTPRTRSVEEPGPGANRVQKTYAVADLVIPVQNASVDDFFLMPEVKPPEKKTRAVGARGQKTLENELIQMIINHVEPASWSVRGGKGTIDYYPLGHALVVDQSAENHERINAFLSSLHRLQDVSVVVEARFISVPEDFYPRLMETVDLEPDEPGPCREIQCKTAGSIRSSTGKQLGILTDRQVLRFVQNACDNPGANIMQAPKMTLFDGQTSVVAVTEKQVLSTGAKTDRPGEAPQKTLFPVYHRFELGVKFAFKPTVSADRRSIHLDVKANIAALANKHVARSPITLDGPAPNASATGKHEANVPVIPVPEFERQTLDVKLRIPNGRTAVFGGWKTTAEETRDQSDLLKGVPVLDGIAQLLEGLTGQDMLLGSAKRDRTPRRLVILVTPRILVSDEAEEARNPAATRSAPVAICTAASDASLPATAAPRLATNAVAGKSSNAAQLQKAMVARLLGSYEKACAAGNRAEAQKLAKMALALDPLCFQRRDE